jgi:hypothetical protein
MQHTKLVSATRNLPTEAIRQEKTIKQTPVEIFLSVKGFCGTIIATPIHTRIAQDASETRHPTT